MCSEALITVTCHSFCKSSERKKTYPLSHQLPWCCVCGLRPWQQEPGLQQAPRGRQPPREDTRTRPGPLEPHRAGRTWQRDGSEMEMDSPATLLGTPPGGKIGPYVLDSILSSKVLEAGFFFWWFWSMWTCYMMMTPSAIPQHHKELGSVGGESTHCQVEETSLRWFEFCPYW